MPSDPASAVPPSPPTAPSSPPRPWTARVGGTPGLVVIVAVAASLILIVGVVAWSGAGGNSGTNSGAGPYSSAKTVAQGVSPLSSGNWVLADATGLDLANSTTLPLDLSGLSENCTVTSLSGVLPTSIAIPAFAGNLTSGLAPVWEFGYLQAATHSLIAVLVIDGSVSVAFQLSGPKCIATNSTIFEGIPGAAVDSPTAASAIDAAGAGAFLAAHRTGVSLEMSLVPFGFSGNGTGLFNAEWMFYYSTCSVFAPLSQPQGETFSAAVNASSGEVVPSSANQGTCGASSPLPGIGSALTFGPPTFYVGGGTGGTLASAGCTTGDYCYSLPLEAVSGNVTPADFDLEVMVQNTSGDTLYPAVGFAITNISGEVLVYSYGSTEAEWTNGTGTPGELMTSAMTLTLDLGTSAPPGANLFLSVTGTGPYSGSELSVGLD